MEEITVEKGHGPVAIIHVFTSDAQAWLERNAPHYGKLHPPAFDGGSYMLVVSDQHDVTAVIEKLRSMGEPA